MKQRIGDWLLLCKGWSKEASDSNNIGAREKVTPASEGTVHAKALK